MGLINLSHKQSSGRFASEVTREAGRSVKSIRSVSIYDVMGTEQSRRDTKIKSSIIDASMVIDKKPTIMSGGFTMS